MMEDSKVSVHPSSTTLGGARSQAWCHQLLWTILCSLLPTTAVTMSVAGAYTGKVLLVSMDGFRWDYLNTISGLENFERMASKGTKAPFVNNTFVTVTFPTHYSIATGLYEESHGLVGNRMYDPVYDDYFSPGNNEGKWWSDGEPIWITTAKQGRKAGCVFFPGTEVELQGIRPNFWLHYDLDMPFKDRVDQIIDWFVNENIDFGTLYFHEPDQSGHDHGPDSQEVVDAVRELDRILGYLIEKMVQHDLDDRVNLIVTSDHGMANKNLSKVVEIPRYIDWDMVHEFVDLECACHIFPKDGREDELYNALNGKLANMHIYRKSEIPEYWHYTNHRRIPPLLIVMDEGWSCTKNASATWVNQKGNHGYDNRNMNMKPIFLAQGPDIKENHGIEPFRSVDIYPLMCELLGLEPAPNNGSLSYVRDMLRNPTPYTAGSAMVGPHMSSMVAIAASCVLLNIIHMSLFSFTVGYH